MEIYYNNYLINYLSNINDFRINIYNKNNNKKYELIDDELVLKYKNLGIDIIDIITKCLAYNNTESFFELIDNDNIITLKIYYKDYIKFSLIISNILCEYKEASILDLKTEILQLKTELKKLYLQIENLSTEIDIGNYVKIPIKIKNLVICSFIDNSEFNYEDIFPFKIKYTLFKNNHYSKHHSYFMNKYYGYKMNFKNESFNLNSHTYHYDQPSENEFYQNETTPFLCFNEIIDCEMIKDMNLENLGLFNIKIKNLNSLKKVKNLYLNNVEFVEDNFGISTFENLHEMNTLGIMNCKNINSQMLQSIRKLHIEHKLKQIMIKDSNIKSEELSNKMTII